jgi:hypothetical protein
MAARLTRTLLLQLRWMVRAEHSLPNLVALVLLLQFDILAKMWWGWVDLCARAGMRRFCPNWDGDGEGNFHLLLFLGLESVRQ